MDAFYASVEQLDNPKLRNKPVAVGGNSQRGVVAAASYEARKFGVKSAMSTKIALSKCPDLIFVSPRFERYKEISNQIRQVFYQYTDLVEPLALDEAFLDVTENKKQLTSASQIAKWIKTEIKELTGLTASAGVSNSKFLAKIASDYDKPDGFYLIHPDKAQLFIEQLEIRKFFGVGKVTAQKMEKLGIYNGADLKKYSLAFLTNQFGKSGEYFFNISRAIDNRPVVPLRERKSIGAENTFESDLRSKDEIQNALRKLSIVIEKRVKTHGNGGKTITMKIRFSDFKTISKSKTLSYYVSNADKIYETSLALLNKEYDPNWRIRLLGISVKNLKAENLNEGQQLTIDF